MEAGDSEEEERNGRWLNTGQLEGLLPKGPDYRRDSKNGQRIEEYCGPQAGHHHVDHVHQAASFRGTRAAAVGPGQNPRSPRERLTEQEMYALPMAELEERPRAALGGGNNADWRDWKAESGSRKRTPGPRRKQQPRPPG